VEEAPLGETRRGHYPSAVEHACIAGGDSVEPQHEDLGDFCGDLGSVILTPTPHAASSSCGSRAKSFGHEKERGRFPKKIKQLVRDLIAPDHSLGLGALLRLPRLTLPIRNERSLLFSRLRSLPLLQPWLRRKFRLLSE
jgi:predicted Rdx family selenoprotein